MTDAVSVDVNEGVSAEVAAAAARRPAPVPVRERISEIDVLRGFALFGVVIVNTMFFAFPMAAARGHGRLVWNAPLDLATAALVMTVFGGKFMTLFSTLFGLGFAIQMDRVVARGGGFVRLYVRRVLALLLIGLVHGLLLWSGDILFMYSLGGLLLLAFRNRRPKTVLAWAFGLMAPMLVFLVIATVVGLKPPASPDPPKAVAEALAAYGQGAWQQIQAQRFADWRWIQNPLSFVALTPNFLFGLWLWRSGFIGALRTRLPLLRRVSVWGIVVGLPAAALLAYAEQGASSPLLGVLSIVGTPILGAGYAAAVLLFAVRGRLQWLKTGLASLGRTCLTNYLLQTVVCTTIFYSYGLGLFGKLSLLAAEAIAVLLYAVQMVVSVWWLRRHQFGPMEWIWRTATYGRRPAVQAA